MSTFEYNDSRNISKQVQLENLLEQLSVQQAIADGATNFLNVIISNEQQVEQVELKLEIEQELRGAQEEIDRLLHEIEKLEQRGESPQVLDSVSPNGYDSFDNGYDSIIEPTTFTRTYPALEKVNQLFETLSQLSQEIGEKIKIMDDLVDSFRNDPLLLHPSISLLDSNLDTILKGLEEKAGKDVRAASYRLLRYLVNTRKEVYTLLLDRHLHFYLVRSLARDSKHDLEKEQSLRLIRRMIQISTTSEVEEDLINLESHYESRTKLIQILRGVVAISEQPEERLRLTSLETLGELLLRDFELLVKCQGLRVVLQAISSSSSIESTTTTTTTTTSSSSGMSSEMSNILATSFLGILDHPDLRKWLRPGIDLEIVLSGFTEVHGRTTTTASSLEEQRIKKTSSIVETLLKSWSGLLYLNVQDRQSLTSLVDSLTNPSKIVRETLLDMLSNLFNVNNGVRKRCRRRTRDGETKTNLIDQFTSILLLTFIDAGLVEGLTELAAHPQESSTFLKVSKLIGEILELSTRILPIRHCAILQSLPKLFNLSIITTTTEGELSDDRLRASDTLLKIAEFNREKRMEYTMLDGVTRRRGEQDLYNSDFSSPLNSQQRRLVETSKLELALSIDDLSFRNLLLETGVLSSSSTTTGEDVRNKWNFELLIELLRGPLRNPKRLDEVLKASKFFKKLLQFFHPSSFKFSDTSVLLLSENNKAKLYVELGCTMIDTLLNDPQGVQYLSEDKLLPQIADCLLQLESTSSSSDTMTTTETTMGSLSTTMDFVFSKERVETTLVSSYFDLLGEMLKTRQGINLLDQFKLFTCFYKVSELRNREDLIRLILVKCCHFSSSSNDDDDDDGHMRVFLHKSLTSSFKQVRLFATNHLANLIMKTSSSSSNEWQISLLVSQLYDPSPEVNHLALTILYRICSENEETLEIVVRLQPIFEHLEQRHPKEINDLLTLFLSSPSGVDYLNEIDWIEEELQEWYEIKNYRYMIELELNLARAFQQVPLEEEEELPNSFFDGTPPIHFYGELVKTRQGCQTLQDSNHFSQFCEMIRQCQQVDHTSYDPEFIRELKSVLWVIGHVGSSSSEGLNFLEQEFILPDLVELACTCPVYSLRGTAVYVLGMLSCTVEGVEMLEELGWESIVKPLTGPTGLSIPINLNDLLYTPIWSTPPITTTTTSTSSSLSHAADSSIDKQILISLANLSNHILATKASKNLTKLKSKHSTTSTKNYYFSPFKNPKLYLKTFEMLGNYQYRQPVRKYVLELFESSSSDDGLGGGWELNQANIEELVEKGKKELVERNNDSSDRIDISTMMGTITSTRVRGMIEGEVTEDEDQSSLEDHNHFELDDDDKGKKKVSLKLLTPLITVKGFLIS